MTKRELRLGVCWIACLVVIAACAPLPATPAETTRQPPTAAAPVATAVPHASTPAQVFSKVSPSVAFIETPTGSGSGFLVDGGYLVTNAHVVWPDDKVRVVFPDGSEHEDVPVVNWDLLADLAVLGPLDVAAPPLALTDGEALPMGSEVYLVGYPGEVEKLPQPTITRGVLSRHREWELAGLTYLQTDATIIGGQSGGVLVSDAGQVIGISGLGWPMPSFVSPGLSFALVASTADLAPRIARLIAGEDASGLGQRRWQFTDGATEQTFSLDNQRHARFFLVKEPPETDVTIDLSGSGEFQALARDLYGMDLNDVERSTELSTTLTFTTEDEQPVVIEVRSLSDSPMDVSLSSASQLYPQEDPDDGKVLARNQKIAGNMDYPGDIDYYQLNLTAGDKVEIVVESMLMTPLLTVDYRGAPPEAAAYSDKAVGIYEDGESLSYQAPHTGRYFVTVEGATGMDTLSYLLEIKAAPPDEDVTPTPTAPDADLDATTAWYRGDHSPFSIRYPRDWQPQEAAPGVAAAYASETGGALEIVEKDLVGLGLGKISQSDYVDQVIRRLSAASPDFKLLSLKPLEIAADVTANAITYTDLGGQRRCASLLYLHQERYAFSATYCAAPARLRALEPLIESSFRSFTVK